MPLVVVALVLLVDEGIDGPPVEGVGDATHSRSS